jgi:hypothetical protein
VALGWYGMQLVLDTELPREPRLYCRSRHIKLMPNSGKASRSGVPPSQRKLRRFANDWVIEHSSHLDPIHRQVLPDRRSASIGPCFCSAVRSVLVPITRDFNLRRLSVISIKRA